MKRIPLWVILLAAGLYGALLLPFFPVGYFNDDALYILGARSLLQGHFVALQLPHPDPLTWILPGYPLFLAPFVWLFTTHFFLLKLTSLLLTLASVLCLWKLLQGWANDQWRWAAVCLFAFNPYTALYSGTVLSEPCFVFLILCVFLLLRQHLEHETPFTAVICGGILAWAALVRPEGALLLPAVALGLAAEKRWKSLSLVLGVAGVLYGAVVGPHYLGAPRNGSLTNFLEQYRSLPALETYRRLLRYAFVAAKAFLSGAFLGLDLPTSRLLLRSLGGLITLLGIGVLGRGMTRFSRHPSLPEGLTIAMASFSLLFLSLHSVWMYFDPRYILPLLPLVWVFALEGLRDLKAPAFRTCLSAGAVGVTLCYGWQGVHWLKQTWDPIARHGRRLPANTFRWIQTSLPPDAALLTAGGSTTFLYTGRHTVPLPPIQDGEEFRYWVVKRGITHVLYQPRPLAFTERQTLWEHSRTWIGKFPNVFRQVYANPEEQTSLFAILPDPAFQQAFELYIAANLDFERSAWKSGIQKLEKALQLAPQFQLARTAYTQTRKIY